MPVVVFEQAKAGKGEGTLDSRTLGGIKKHISSKVSLRGSCFRSVIVSGFDVRFSKTFYPSMSLLSKTAGPEIEQILAC